MKIKSILKRNISIALITTIVLGLTPDIYTYAMEKGNASSVKTIKNLEKNIVNDTKIIESEVVTNSKEFIDAIKNAQIKTVILGNDIILEDSSIDVYGVDKIIDGQGHKLEANYDGQLIIKENLTVKNIEIDKIILYLEKENIELIVLNSTLSNATYYDSTVINARANSRVKIQDSNLVEATVDGYEYSLEIENSNITKGKIMSSSSEYEVSIKNSNFKEGGYIYCERLNIDNCTFKNDTYISSIRLNSGNITNSKFDGFTVECMSGDVNIENVEIEANGEYQALGTYGNTNIRNVKIKNNIGNGIMVWMSGNLKIEDKLILEDIGRYGIYQQYVDNSYQPKVVLDGIIEQIGDVFTIVSEYEKQGYSKVIDNTNSLNKGQDLSGNGYYNTKYRTGQAPNLPTNEKPEILGATDKIIELEEELDLLLDIKANDFEDGDITNNIVISGEVNNKIIGEYEIIYSVTDSDGNTTSKIIKVIVTYAKEDIDINEIIDINDLAALAIKYNTRNGEASWNERCDLNRDSIVDILDITILAKKI